jgi:hypothetical protein
MENIVFSKMSEDAKKDYLDKIKADKLKALKEGKIVNK